MTLSGEKLNGGAVTKGGLGRRPGQIVVGRLELGLSEGAAAMALMSRNG